MVETFEFSLLIEWTVYLACAGVCLGLGEAIVGLGDEAALMLEAEMKVELATEAAECTLVLAKLPLLLRLLKLAAALALRQPAELTLLLMREAVPLVFRCELSEETEVPLWPLPADWFVLTVFVFEFSDKESSFLTASGEWVPTGGKRKHD